MRLAILKDTTTISIGHDYSSGGNRYLSNCRAVVTRSEETIDVCKSWVMAAGSEDTSWRQFARDRFFGFIVEIERNKETRML